MSALRPASLLLAAAALLALVGGLTLTSTAQAQTPSTDTTLSSLVVNDGSTDLPLIPGGSSFDPVSIVDVSHDVETVTVTATPTDPNATVQYVGPDGYSLLDRPDGLVVDLAVGYRNIIMYVYAEDGVTFESHKVEVFRAPPATPSCTLNPGDVWCSLVTITLDAAGSYAGYTAAMSDFDFTYFEKTLRFQFVSVRGGTLSLAFYPSKPITSNFDAYRNLYLQIGDDSFPIMSGCDFRIPICSWQNTGLDWSSATTVTVRLREKDVTNAELPLPVSLGAEPKLPGEIRFSWWRDPDNASKDLVTSHQYRYAVRGASIWTDWTSVPQTTLPALREDEISNYNSVLLKDLTPGTEYQFWVRSVRGVGYSQAVTIFGTPIDRQTVWITGSFGSVEEGEPLRFTLWRDQSRGGLDVILRISETGDMLPQEEKGRRHGFSVPAGPFQGRGHDDTRGSGNRERPPRARAEQRSHRRGDAVSPVSGTIRTLNRYTRSWRTCARLRAGSPPRWRRPARRTRATCGAVWSRWGRDPQAHMDTTRARPSATCPTPISMSGPTRTRLI